VDSEVRSGVIQWTVRETLGAPVIVVLLSLIANEWGWVMAWLLGGVFLLAFVAQAVLLIPRSPELLAARTRRLRKDSKAWDKVLLPSYGLATLATLAHDRVKAHAQSRLDSNRVGVVTSIRKTHALADQTTEIQLHLGANRLTRGQAQLRG